MRGDGDIPKHSQEAPGGQRSAPVAYLLKMFPRLSETFILNEILELRRRGIDLRIISLLPPSGSVLPPEAEPLIPDTFYAPHPRWRPQRQEDGPGRILRDHLFLFRQGRRRYLHSFFLMFRRFSGSAWKRFLQAGPVARYCLEQQIRLLHGAFAHTPTSVAFWVSRLTGLPYSFAAHAKDLYLSQPESMRRKAAAARFVYTCTEANGRHLANLSPEARIHVQYHGCDLDRFLASGPVPSEPPLILTVARLVPKKGLHILLQAARRLADASVEFRLVMIGDGPLRASLEQQVKELGLENRVDLLGSLPQEEVRSWYSRAALVTLPSVVLDSGDRDGIPNTLVEAMAMGVPVISTRISGIPELIQDGHTGLLVDPGSSEQLERAILEVLQDPDAARDRVRRAQDHVRERFDLRRNGAILAALLRRHSGISRCLYLSADSGVPIRGHKGASAHVRQVAREMDLAGVETRILTSNPGPVEADGNRVEVPLIEAPIPGWMETLVRRAPGNAPKRLLREIRRLLYNITMYRSAVDQIRAFRPDFLYERYSLCAVAGSLAARKGRLPLVLEVNAPLADEERRYRGLILGRMTRYLERRILRSADQVYVVSHPLRRWALGLGVHPDRVAVLPNGVDLSCFQHGPLDTDLRAAWGWSENYVVVGFAGSLKPWHGVEQLFDAFASARSRHPQLRLVFMGEGPEGKRLRRRARELGDHVHFTGALPQHEVARALRSCDILAAPYLPQDPFYFSPLKILEYLAAGRPVIATDQGDIHLWVNDGCGRLVAAGDTGALARAMEELGSDAGLREMLGRQAAVAAREHDWSRRVERILGDAHRLREVRLGNLSPWPENRPPRVAYVLKMFPRFSETFIVNEILELEKQGIEVRVFSMKRPSGRRQARASRVSALTDVLPKGPGLLSPTVLAAHLRSFALRPGPYISTLHFALGRRDVRAMIKFLQAGLVADTCRREKVGHLHAHFASGPTRLAKFSSMISGIPFSFTAHAKDLYWEGHGHDTSHKLKKRVKLSRFVVTVSKENETFLRTRGFRVSEGRIRTVHIGLDLDEFPFCPPSERVGGPRPLILAVGRLVEKKGFHILIRSLRLLRDQGMSFRCLIAGEGPEESALRSLIESQGLQDAVRLLGPVPLDRLRSRYYRRARVLVQPSVVARDGDRDGIPTVLLEAMAMGVPVVSTRVSGIPEAVEDGKNGFLVEAGDAKALARRITELLRNPALSDRLAMAARSRIEVEFDQKKNAGALRKLFLRSMAGWTPPASSANRTAGAKETTSAGGGPGGDHGGTLLSSATSGSSRGASRS